MLDTGGSDSLPHQNANFCSVPQCCGWDGDGSSSLVAPLCRGSLCCPQNQPLGWQEGSKKGGKVLLALDFRKGGTLREALI